MAENSPEIWRATIRRRAVVAAAAFIACSMVVAGGAVYLQVFQHEEMVKLARGQHLNTRNVPATRGNIVDRNGVLLASTVTEPTIAAMPAGVTDVPATVKQLCEAFQDCTPEVRKELEALLSSGKTFTYLKHRVSPEIAKRIAQLKDKQKLPGVWVEPESYRSYPNLQLASHVLGAVGDKENEKPHGGIELSYDKILRGRDGRVLEQIDVNRRVFNSQVETAPVPGTSLELTIDINIQNDVERALYEGVVDNDASGGTALVMDSNSGEILAFACYPTFDPNPPRRVTNIVNPAVAGYFEPGSAFKTFTAAAALEEKVVTPDEIIDVSPGKVVFGPGNEIRDTHIHKRLSFTDVIAQSSNVGTYKAVRRIRRENFVETLRRFGFGVRTSRAFPGETKGRVPSASDLKTESAVARAAIGYSVGVTALQMAAALNSIANGGELLQPRIVRAFFNDSARQTTERVVLNRTVSTAVAAQVTRILEEAVETGTGKPARIPGYTVAGKTGTAEKLGAAGYSNKDHNVSFIGFVPSRAPRFTIVVVIDSPKGPNGHFAGPVAGPVFARIGDAALRYARIPPTINPPTPVLVAHQSKDATPPSSSGSSAASLTPVEHRQTSDGLTPDVTGLSARDAMSVLTKAGLAVKLIGFGTVHEQRPAAGTPVGERGKATLWLSRTPDTRIADAGRR